MSTDALLGWAGIALFGVALAVGLAVELGNPNGLLRTAWAKYTAFLERELRFLRHAASPARMAGWQAGGLIGLVLAGLLLQQAFLLFGLPLVLFLPLYWLKREHRRRVQAIEMQLDSWLLILANALKATPSLGEAMSASAKIIRPPMRDELDVCLKEIQLGTPLDQAVINMSERIGSRTFSSALATVLVGRQTGGDLPQILDQSAATLREMARLEGVVRTKTAEGKSQAWVLGAIPFLLLAAIHYIDPNWLRPLTQQFAGYVIITVAAILWASAIVLARKILAVDI